MAQKFFLSEFEKTLAEIRISSQNLSKRFESLRELLTVEAMCSRDWWGGDTTLDETYFWIRRPWLFFSLRANNRLTPTWSADFENPPSAPLIALVVTITPVSLLYHIRTFYIVRYISPTTYLSQPTYTKRKRKRNTCRPTASAWAGYQYCHELCAPLLLLGTSCRNHGFVSGDLRCADQIRLCCHICPVLDQLYDLETNGVCGPNFKYYLVGESPILSAASTWPTWPNKIWRRSRTYLGKPGHRTALIFLRNNCGSPATILVRKYFSRLFSWNGQKFH